MIEKKHGPVEPSLMVENASADFKMNENKSNGDDNEEEK